MTSYTLSNGVDPTSFTNHALAWYMSLMLPLSNSLCFQDWPERIIVGIKAITRLHQFARSGALTNQQGSVVLYKRARHSVANIESN